jgi:hypothetical protein
MKLKKIFIISLFLQITSNLYTSDLLTLINTANLNLVGAQTTVANLLGITPSTNIGKNTQNSSQIITMLTNTTTQPVYLVMLDQNLKKINPTNILLNANDSTYILANAISIQIVDKNNIQLTATTITQNYLYTINNNENAWTISGASVSENSTLFSCTNSTTVPFIIAVTTGNFINSQQIAPGAKYSQSINSTSPVTIKAHANLSAIACTYDSASSYSLSITGGTISCIPTSPSGNTLTNNSGWPMLISFTLPNNQKDITLVEDGDHYQPNIASKNIMIIPIIPNYITTKTFGSSCTIANNNGKINLQFT